MSRVEENLEMIKHTKGRFSGNCDQVMCSMMGEILGVLLDISKSLAIIADTQLEYLHSETEPPIFPEVIPVIKEEDDGK